MIVRALLSVPVIVCLGCCSAFACPDGQYEDPVLHVCMPKSNVRNVPNDITRGLGDITRGRAPPPAQLGTIGGKRVCFPWC
jgi:hypothetical protein